MYLVTAATLFDESAKHFDSLGRLAFIGSQLGAVWVYWRIFHPNSGCFSHIIRERPDRLLTKTRWIWFSIIVGCPLFFVCVAASGASITAILLNETYNAALRWVAVGVVLYGILLRWSLSKQRRIALQEALKERKERRETAEKTAELSEEAIISENHQIEMDLESVARQTRQLLRSLVSVGMIILIVHTITSSLHLDSLPKDIAFDGGMNLMKIVHAALYVIVTFTVVKNLPGLLDIMGLRQSGMAPGTRYAVSTLVQYAVAAIGILIVSYSLELDWSKLSWIAAALSVGLGFGLQEIVANFVCGIIILFERPIRVDDVVTVGNVTGKVSRIRMRATTITNWDRQEFVVPNKEFITGSLINWTLSSPLNRITIKVGVAYGSDTALARNILSEIAAAHPKVLEDPAPLITFDTFGDSTLDLSMRIYLANMDNRLVIVTEIHEEIDRRFKEAGLEIAFPQRDLHIRSVPDGFIPPSGEAPEAKS